MRRDPPTNRADSTTLRDFSTASLVPISKGESREGNWVRISFLIQFPSISIGCSVTRQRMDRLRRNRAFETKNNFQKTVTNGLLQFTYNETRTNQLKTGARHAGYYDNEHPLAD
jgi:hypothetical protein